MKRKFLYLPFAFAFAFAFASLTLGSTGCSEVVALDHYHIVSSPQDVDASVEASAPAACTVATPDPATLRGCLLLTGCVPYIPIATIGGCVATDGLADAPAAACIRAAESCDDILKCTGLANAESLCTTGSPAVRCVGNKAVECDTIQVVRDCDVLGGTCETFASSGSGTPDAVDCKVLSSCKGTSEACSGNVAYSCGKDGKGYGEDCSKDNGKCIAVADQAGCVAAGESCVQGSDGTCDGDTAVVCGAAGKINYDCSKSGLACVVDDATKSLHCLAPGCAIADDDACEDSCSSSTTLSICLGGVKTDVDCTEYGFTACVPQTDKGLGKFATCEK